MALEEPRAPGLDNDSDKVVDALDRLSDRLESADRAAQSGSGALMSGARLAGAGVVATGTAIGVHRAARAAGGYGNMAVGAARTAGTLPGAIGGLAGGVGGKAAKALMMLRFAGPAMMAVAGGVMMGRAVFGGGGGGSRGGGGGGAGRELERQTDLLAKLYRESQVQSKSAAKLQAIAVSRQDPFGATANQTLRRMRQQGTLVTAGETYRASRYQAALGERSEASQAIKRALDDILLPLRTGLVRAQSMGLRFINSGVRGAPVAGSMLGALGNSSLPGVLPGQNSMLQWGYRGARWGYNQLSGFLGGNTPNPMTTGPLGGSLQRELFQMQLEGPGRVAGSSPTVRAGTAGEYAFRVQQQTRQLNREIERDWQDKVLSLLDQLVELGKISEDERFKAERRFNRQATVEGVSG